MLDLPEAYSQLFRWGCSPSCVWAGSDLWQSTCCSYRCMLLSCTVGLVQAAMHPARLPVRVYPPCMLVCARNNVQRV